MHPKNLHTQEYINTLDAWSDKHRMKIYEKKTRIRLINFTKNNQFTNKVKLRRANIEQVSKANVLGTIPSDDLI